MKPGAFAHREKINEKEEAFLRYREMLVVSKKMEFSDAKACAVICIDREIETLKNIKGLEFALKVSWLKKVKKELLTIIHN